MQFKIEKITEDSFYVNVLLGLPKILAKYKKFGVKGHTIKRLPPLRENDICTWEHNNGVLLPYDLRKFYTSTNGFLFKWLMNFGKDATDIVGKIEINPLSDLVRVLPPEGSTSLQVMKDGAYCTPPFGNNYKLFELVTLPNGNKVVIVFSKYKFANNIWLSANEKYSYLTTDFSSYFRMCICHLGIPHWELLYTEEGPPQWTANLITLLAPHIPLKKARILPPQKRSKREHVNKLDLNIFKSNYDIRKNSKKLAAEKIVVKNKPNKGKHK